MSEAACRLKSAHKGLKCHFLLSRKQQNAFFFKAGGHAAYQHKASVVYTFTYRHLHFPELIEYFVRGWISPKILQAEELNL